MHPSWYVPSLDSTHALPASADQRQDIAGGAGGAALTNTTANPVTVSGVVLAKVATSANYSDLVAKPRSYISTSSVAVPAITAALAQPNNIAYYIDTVSVLGISGVATIYPTSDATATGTALFNSILSVSAVAYVPSPSLASSGVTVVVTSIATNLKTVTLMASTGTSNLGGFSYAAANTLLMCTVVGTYAS